MENRRIMYVIKQIITDEYLAQKRSGFVTLGGQITYENPSEHLRIRLSLTPRIRCKPIPEVSFSCVHVLPRVYM
ncbi:hypothetical protein HanIR_Chr06g0284151 [Helianthus annuus]|nr:hypothetical protein HanIR_Chr06g0284151 [Helianthus annuus]